MVKQIKRYLGTGFRLSRIFFIREITIFETGLPTCVQTIQILTHEQNNRYTYLLCYYKYVLTYFDLTFNLL